MPSAAYRRLTGSIVVFLAVYAAVAEAGIPGRCRRECDPAIANCILSTGQSLRVCKRRVIRACKRGQLDACDMSSSTTHATTTTTSTTTSTTFTGQRLVDNGDGTVTDLQTGLQWEKKDGADGVPGLGTPNLANPHDVDNQYTWSATVPGMAPDGKAFTDFLGRLNHCVSSSGVSVSGGFAGHCDWRLPTSVELLTIIDPSACAGSCIDATFGPTAKGDYLSSTGNEVFDVFVWLVSFGYGGIQDFDFSKGNPHYVRAVRGLLPALRTIRAGGADARARASALDTPFAGCSDGL